MSYYDHDEDRADYCLAQAGELRCGLCHEPADRVVRCAGDHCLAHVGGCCLSADSLCIECDAERCRTALPDRVRRLVWSRLPWIAERIRHGEVSPRVAALACDLVDAYEEEQR